MPASGLQRGLLLFVACHVPLELGRPELHVGLRRARRLAALVTMPEAAVNEDDRVPLGKHDVRVSRQFR